MLRLLALALVCCLLLPATALGDALAQRTYDVTGLSVVRRYDSPTLKYTVESFKVGPNRASTYVTKIWMENPGRQIVKANCDWGKALADPLEMAKRLDGAALVINGSGFVSPVYPEIPDEYPGSSPDYYYTSLGSLAVTDSEVLRCLEGVPYYGLTLQEDGLHIHVGDDPAQVLRYLPSQTWSFYEGCPMVVDHVSVLDREWDFAARRAIRNMICKVDDNNYVLLMTFNMNGLTLMDAVDWLMASFDPEWIYNLDGGPSATLMCRKRGNKGFKVMTGGTVHVADVMGFTE